MEKRYSTAKLDVLTHNIDATTCYQSRCWHIDHEFAGMDVGDKPVPMYEMQKT